MKLKRELALLSLLFLVACSGSGADVESPSTPANTQEVVLKPGDYDQTISSGGVERKYILHVPQGYDASKPLPLLFVLHGHGGTAQSMVKLTSLNGKADQQNFFVAYLQGTLGADGAPAWNTGLTPELNISVDDVAFVRELAGKLEGQMNVDSQRIYAAGFSNGGFMCHRLGAELPDLLASVAVVEGTIGSSLDEGVSFQTIPPAKGPISVAIVHGLEDPTVPYDGGLNNSQKFWVKSVAEAVDFWTTADACTAQPTEQTSTDGNVITKDYSGCTGGTEVELFTVNNGRHEWPTLEGHTGFSASDAIWDFFSRHSKATGE